MATSDGPDGGRAWSIAITAGLINMILSGTSKMVGLLYVAVIDYYQVSRKEATLPFTLRKSLRNLSGPIVGILGQKFGIQSVTLAGGFVAALGAGLSYFAPTVTWLAVTWGVVHGVGEAFANTLFHVIVNQHFEKHRSTATGIALSGACIGSVFFSFLVEYLIEEYGLQGTFLIMCGIILNVIPAAMILKSPSWIREGNKKQHKNPRLKENLNNDLPMLPDNKVKSNIQGKLSISALNPRLLVKNGIRCSSNDTLKSPSSDKFVTSLDKKFKNKKCFDNLAFDSDSDTKSKNSSLEQKLSIQNLIATLRENNTDPNSRNLSFQSSLTVSSNQSLENSGDKEKAKSVLESLKTIGKLYTNPVYLLICVCMVTYVFVIIPIMTSMIDYGQDKGLPETVGKYLIHTMAVGDIIGRVCFGWVTDKNFLSIPHYMTLTLLLQGAFLLLIPTAFSLWSYLILLTLYSMSAGSMLVRLPVLVLKNVRKEEQSVAISCYAFISGLVPLGVPSVIGHFRDNCGSYDGMYYLLGGLSILSGGFWIFEPLLVRLNDSLKEKRQNNI